MTYSTSSAPIDPIEQYWILRLVGGYALGQLEHSTRTRPPTMNPRQVSRAFIPRRAATRMPFGLMKLGLIAREARIGSTSPPQ